MGAVACIFCPRCEETVDPACPPAAAQALLARRAGSVGEAFASPLRGEARVDRAFFSGLLRRSP